MQHFILYKTTNLINNKTYIGIHQTNNLDDGYLGSGVAFKRALKKYGVENFIRETLEVCSSFEELLEKERIYVNEEWVSLKDNYNLKTGGQSTGILSKESRDKISKTLKDGYNSGRIKVTLNRLGKTPWNKDKKLKDFLSPDDFIVISLKISNGNKGKIPWNKGKKGVQKSWNKGIKSGPMADEQKKQISETQKKIRDENPALNKIQSEKLKEYYRINPHPTKGLKPHNKGKESPKTTCPHCEKIIDIGNAKRWHFDNCKLKYPMR